MIRTFFLIFICLYSFLASAEIYYYDDLNRLMRVEYDQGKAINFSHDAAGNLLSINSEGVNTHAYDPLTGQEDDFTNTSDVPEGWVIGVPSDYDGDGENDIVDLDDDNDSLPDSWEEQYGLDSKDNSDASSDNDGDGFTNLQEFQANSDPSIASSTPDNPYELQQIIVSGCGKVGVDQVSSCEIRYKTSDNNPDTTGLGLRIHFDANALEFVEVKNIFSTGFESKDEQPLPDSANYDDDVSTTHYLTISWGNGGANWPGQTSSVRLYDIDFKFKDGSTIGDQSTLKFTASRLASSYRLQATDTVLTLVNPCSLDIDKNGETRPLTDGLLILRYMFNLRGLALIDGVVAANAQRTTQSDIEGYLGQCQSVLDIDDNGEMRPLTDGLLILRHMFNLRGEVLIDGVVAPTAQRRTADEIEVYLQSLSP